MKEYLFANMPRTLDDPKKRITEKIGIIDSVALERLISTSV